MILVICALAAELRGFERPGVTSVAVGVGPVEAAVGTTRAICAQRYDLVINAGIGGGFAGRVAVGDGVAVTYDHYIDIGREDRSELSLPGGVQLRTGAASDEGFIGRLRASVTPSLLHVGTALTSATITTSTERADRLAALYTPLVESMEGFAVLRACSVAATAAVELRGISNVVGDRAAAQWDFRAGSSAAVRLLEALIDVVEANV